MNRRKGLVYESILALMAVLAFLAQHTSFGFGSARVTDFLGGFASGLSLVALVGWLLYAFLESGDGQRA